MAKDKQKVLILGGGFGGIKAALELAGQPDFALTLLSDHPDFRYYPALYHAATGGRRAASSIPLQEIFNGRKVEIIIDEAVKIDRQNKTVTGRSALIYDYDKLIIALGMVTNYFGIKGLAVHSYGIKTLGEAQQLRDHLHQLIADEGQPDLNYIVIGGGSTGVELAGALPAYLHWIMQRHDVMPKAIHIELVEAMPRLLPRMPRAYSNAVAKRLRKLGVKLYLNQAVETETGDTLTVSGHDIQSRTVIWTAGVINHPFFKANDFVLSEHGKVPVNEQLQAEPDIYVIGDNAETPYSGMAQTALHDAVFVAGNLKYTAAGKAPLPYRPKKPIYITPVGPKWAAVQWGGFQIYGWLGWILRKLADYAGYHDYEPWWLAGRHWLASNSGEENCPVCARQKL